MFKAFFKLWLVVFLPLFLLIFPNQYSPITMFNEYAERSRFVDAYSGTFYLIEKRLLALDKQEWPQAIDKLAGQFGYTLSIAPVDKLNLNQSQVESLLEGEFVFVNTEPELLLKNISESSQVVYLELDLSEDEEILRASKGTIYLIQEMFNNSSVEKWPEIIEQISDGFNYDVSFKKLEALTLSAKQRKQLRENGFTWTRSDNGTLTFYSSANDDEYLLTAEEISTTSVNPMLIVIILLTFVLVISLGMFLWVNPLWRDLNRLADTAKRFGEGDLELRAEMSKTSVIARLGGSFNRMAQRIETLVKNQKELTNAIAHDLRTPLYRLRFAFEMLESKDLSEEEKAKYLGSASASIDGLDHLINQTLVFSRYSRISESVDLKPCIFAKNLEREIEFVSQENQALEFDLIIAPELTTSNINVDLRAMNRAVNNLISNACRHAKKKICVSLNLSKKQYQLIVEDDGRGIEEQYWEQIFQPFTQLDNQQRDQNIGHGLGLSIVQRIATLHNGGVKLSHSDLGGAKFELFWPKIVNSG